MDDLITARSRHRVRVLGQILGETMTAQHGQEFLDKIEEIRLLATVRRQDESSENNLLQHVLKSLDDDHLISVARAFNQFLNLTNIAEQAETTDERTVPYPSASYLKDVFDRLISNNIDQERIIETATNIR